MTTPSIARINPPELGTPPGYSQIVEVSAGRIIFIAGQAALDRDGNVVGKGDFAGQAAQVFDNLAIALTAARCTAANLVKLTVFVTDMDNLFSYREARNSFFATVTPPNQSRTMAASDASSRMRRPWCGGSSPTARRSPSARGRSRRTGR